jgi:fructose-bisphosphate aldolase, class I
MTRKRLSIGQKLINSGRNGVPRGERLIVPRMQRLLRNGKAMFLAYDHGLEHGPLDFNLRTVNPQYILDIALEGGYTGVILQSGVAQKYYHGVYKSVPLIVKLNGKTDLPKMDPISRQICSVERAVKLGAEAVGYTIYDGSRMEPEIFREFGRIVEEAHDYGIPVIAWMYPRGVDIGDEKSNEILAYSARIGLELGADMVKLKYNGDVNNFKWVVKCAGRTKIVMSGGDKREPLDFFKEAYDVAVEADCAGVAVGRNVWQDDRPFSLSKALEQVIFFKKKPEEVMYLLK